MLSRALLFYCCIISLIPAASLAQKPYYQTVGQDALSEIRWDWRPKFPDLDIRFHGGRKGLLALSNSDTRIIDVWIRRHHTRHLVAASIVHELAHMFDKRYLNWQQRGQWLEVRGIPPGTQWYPPCESCTDYSYGAGDFAESVSVALQGRIAEFRSKLGPPPSEAQQKLIWKWIKELNK